MARAPETPGVADSVTGGARMSRAALFLVADAETTEQITQVVCLWFGQVFDDDAPLAVRHLFRRRRVKGAGWITIREFLTLTFRQVLLWVVIHAAIVRQFRSGRPSSNDLNA